MNEHVGCFALDREETQLILTLSVRLQLSSALHVFLHCPFTSEVFLYHKAGLLLHTVQSQTPVMYYSSYMERKT